MKINVLLLFLIYSIYLNAQATNSTISSEPETFKNQGEQENYWAKKLFEEKYTLQAYNKFSGTTLVKDKSTIKFDNKTLIIWGFEPELLKIFTDGIFYPQLLLGNMSNTPEKSKSELDALSEGERLMYFLTKNDTLKISDFEELKFLSTTPTVKRFRFWKFTPGFINPQVYFIELTNKNATEKTDLSIFIKGAKLTFMKDGWLII